MPITDPHDLSEPKQLRYPGGKNGFWEVACSCGYRTSPHATAAAARKPAEAHQRDVRRLP